jgi:hypothetical protein
MGSLLGRERREALFPLRLVAREAIAQPTLFDDNPARRTLAVRFG